MSYIAVGKKYLNEALEYLESKTARQILVVSVVVVLGAGGYYINRYFADQRQRNAVAAFSEAMQTYLTALSVDLDWSKKDEKAPWDKVQLAFQTAYAQNSSAKFAPFFLINTAQALAAQQKHTEAAKLIGEALAKLPTSSPFYNLYSVVQAAILIDGGDDSGVTQLKNLAADANNSYNDMAKYYLAQYYLAQEQNEAAQTLFKELAAQKPVTMNEQFQQASWAELAKEYV